MHIASFLKCFQGHRERNALVLHMLSQSCSPAVLTQKKVSINFKEVGKGHASKNKWGKNGAVLPALFRHMSHMYRINILTTEPRPNGASKMAQRTKNSG